MNDDLDQTRISPEAAYEPAADAAPAARVVPPAAAVRGGRLRWAIALGVVALVVVATMFAISLFTGRAANAVVLGYIPGDAIAYGEARLDLPGDQRAAVGQFLSKFPGFADQSVVDTKIDEVLDRLVGSATNGDQTFSSDIKPWFGGEVAFSVGALPDPAQMSSGASAMNSGRFLILVSVKDEAAGKAWFDSVIASGGAANSTESYAGATLTLFGSDGAQQGAFALLNGKVAVVGDVTSVKAAVDTKGAGGFATKPEVKAALDATSGDHVGFVYVALRSLVEWSSQLGGATVPSGGALADLIPEWGAFALRVEGDALVMEAIRPTLDGDGAADARTSAVADHVPSSAIALTIANDYGKGIVKALDTYRSDPSMKSTIDAIDQAIAVIGGPDAAIGWIGDLGITVNRTDGGLEGGVVIVPTDRAAADRLFTSLRALVAVGGVTMGVTVRDEAYAGTTITIVDIGDIASLAAQGGLSPDMLGTTPLPTGHVQLAFASTDQVVVIGADPGFVRHVLDTTAATSIASNDRYKALAGRIGQGTGFSFADLTAIRELVESAMATASPADRAQYEQSVKPFLVPFDALVASNSVKGEVSRSTLIVTVK